jgi:hypothetical protein
VLKGEVKLLKGESEAKVNSSIEGRLRTPGHRRGQPLIRMLWPARASRGMVAEQRWCQSSVPDMTRQCQTRGGARWKPGSRA